MAFSSRQALSGQRVQRISGFTPNIPPVVSVGDHSRGATNQPTQEQPPGQSSSPCENQMQSDGRRQWSRQENRELLKCWLRVNPEQRGFRKRLFEIWNARYPDRNESEQKLTGQVRAILRRKHFSDLEVEEMKRELEKDSPEETTILAQQSDYHEQNPNRVSLPTQQHHSSETNTNTPMTTIKIPL